jgi:dipeptidyl-peptidase-4
MYKMPIVVSTVPGARHQLPYLHTQNIPLPGSARLPMMQAMVFDLESGRRVDLKPPGPVIYGDLAWSGDGRRAFWIHDSADFRSITVLAADVETGETHVATHEEAKLPLRGSGSNSERVTTVGNGEEIVLYSERDGWPHYYLYDGETGRLKKQLTRGEWAVHEVRHVDARGRWLYFTAGGREKGRDPYYAHLYRVRLDGSRLELLTPENAHHEVQFAPGGEYFIDTFSTVDQPPVSVVRTSGGRRVMELMRADVADLRAFGWQPPQRMKFKAADGETDIYASVFMPAGAAPGRKLPVIDFLYAGPSIIWAARQFLEDNGGAAPASQLGFVTIAVDGRGTPLRSRAFQDVSFGPDFGSKEIMADHVAAIRQLAERCGCVDLDRVGVAGKSWGGYRAARAMFQFPDFFKVGVAAAGSHDNYIHMFGHDRWFGREADFPGTYLAQSNVRLAGALQGRLLLVHGEADEITHPANTLQVVDALIRANKDFDMLILPDRGHDIGGDGYYTRKRWDYFVRHLLGAEPPSGVRVPDRPPDE